MRIIIVGIGKVGRTLTEFLTQEGHDIIIIDSDYKVVQDVVNIFDVRGIEGNGACYDIQLKAEATKADILIATTESDELNILSCLVGIKNGIPNTIARVRNPEYSNQIDFMHNELGLNMIVNPELETANEISRLLRFPSALKIESFAKGKVDIVEIIVSENLPIINKSLIEIRQELKTRMLVCAVERDGTVIIPSGKFIINKNDKLYIIASKSEMSNLFRKLGMLKKRTKSVMIIGGGKISYYLSKQLIESHIKVKIVEIDNSRCEQLTELLPGVTIINGDGNNQDLLIEEGIKSVDAFVTLTGYDEENIIIALFADTLNVPKVIPKINRNNSTNILKAVGLNSALSPKAITANRIISYVRSLQNTSGSQMETLYKLIDNRVEAVEFIIPQETGYTGIALKDLPLKDNILIACIIRQNNIIIPVGDDQIKPNDRVIIIIHNQYITSFDNVLR